MWEYQTKNKLSLSMVLAACLLIIMVLFFVYKPFQTRIIKLVNPNSIQEDKSTPTNNLTDANNPDNLSQGDFPSSVANIDKELFFIDSAAEINLTDPSQVEEDDSVVFYYQDLLANTASVYLENAVQDQIYSLQFGDVTYFDLNDELKRPKTAALLASYEADLLNLVNYFNSQFQRPAPDKRYSEISLLIPTTVLTTYPNERVVLAYAIERLLIELDYANEDIYIDLTKDYINRGIAYGMYLPSDIMASRVLVDQYFDLILDNSAFLEMLETARSEF